MTEDRAIESFQIEIPRAPALRLLGYGAAERTPRDSVKQLFDEEMDAAESLVAPIAVMGRSHGGLPQSTYVDESMPLVAAVCTIGNALERRVAELAAGGDSARAAVLDAIGSAAVEEVADRCNQMICAMAAPTDYAPDSRSSPGYGRWNVREQVYIFDFLDPSEIGVTLTDSAMMTPRKSVSFVVPLEGGTVGGSAHHRCDRCGLEDCPYRHGEAASLLDWLTE